LSNELGSARWMERVARLVGGESFEELSDALRFAIREIAGGSHMGLLAFRHDAPPEVLTHDLSPRDEQHYLQRYIAGPYLLDPLYQIALKADKPGCVRFRDVTPDRFRSSEYYRQYCEKTHLGDEMDFFVDVEPNTTIVLVVALLKGRFSRTQLAALAAAEPLLHATMGRVFRLRGEAAGQDATAISMHERLTECFKNFGAAVLTQREREITQLLLRGHSTKSIARELDIAPGTVMVHKRNLFAKLGITSQYELFSRFIDKLSAA